MGRVGNRLSRGLLGRAIAKGIDNPQGRVHDVPDGGVIFSGCISGRVGSCLRRSRVGLRRGRVTIQHVLLIRGDQTHARVRRRVFERRLGGMGCVEGAERTSRLTVFVALTVAKAMGMAILTVAGINLPAVTLLMAVSKAIRMAILTVAGINFPAGTLLMAESGYSTVSTSRTGRLVAAFSD